jgi:hypothetical protein
VYRVGAQRYRVQIRGSGHDRYAVIQAPKPSGSTTPSSGMSTVAAAVQQELTNLARTGGGALGRLIQSGIFPTALLVFALTLILAGLIVRWSQRSRRDRPLPGSGESYQESTSS